jgi:hypothetical protein
MRTLWRSVCYLTIFSEDPTNVDTLQPRRHKGSSSIKDLAEHRGIEQDLVSDTWLGEPGLCAREASAALKRAARSFVARFLQAAALGHHTPVWMGTGDRGCQYDVCDVKAFEKKAVLQQSLCHSRSTYFIFGLVLDKVLSCSKSMLLEAWLYSVD